MKKNLHNCSKMEVNASLSPRKSKDERFLEFIREYLDGELAKLEGKFLSVLLHLSNALLSQLWISLRRLSTIEFFRFSFLFLFVKTSKKCIPLSHLWSFLSISFRVCLQSERRFCGLRWRLLPLDRSHVPDQNRPQSSAFRIWSMRWTIESSPQRICFLDGTFESQGCKSRHH